MGQNISKTSTPTVVNVPLQHAPSNLNLVPPAAPPPKTGGGGPRQWVKIGGVSVTVVKGQLTDEQVDVYVNGVPSNFDMSIVPSKKLSNAAGAALEADCKKRYPNGLKIGDIADTGGFNSKCQRVYHVTLPKSQQDGSQNKSITDSVKNCLERANKKSFSSIAVPDLGSPIGYPPSILADLMFTAVEEFSKGKTNPNLSQVVFSIFKNQVYTAFVNKAKEISTQNSEQGADFPKALCFEAKDIAEIMDVLKTMKDAYPKESDASISNHLLESLDIGEFKNKLKSLESRVILVDPTNLCKDSTCNVSDGHVCIYRVEVNPSNRLLIVKELTSTLDTLESTAHLPRLFLVSSHSVCIIDAKLAVYKQFKYLFKFHNFRVIHELDSNKEFLLYCCKHTIDSFRSAVEKIVQNLRRKEIQRIVENAAFYSISLDAIKQHCQNLEIIDEGRNIESVHDGSYLKHSSRFSTSTIKTIITKTIEKIGDKFTFEVLIRLELLILEKGNRSNFLKDIKSKGFGMQMVRDYLYGSVVRFLNPLLTIMMVIKKETVTESVNINSVEWRHKIGKEVYDIIQGMKDKLIYEIVSKLKHIFDKTESDLMELVGRLGTASRKIPIRDQMKLIDEWMLREFRIENIERCPSVLHFITGRKKNAIVMKVFLQNAEDKAKIFCRDHAINVPDNALFEYIDVSLKSDSKTSFTAIMQRKEKGFHIKSEIKRRMKDILKNKKEELFSKHSNLVSISMSPVKYSGDDVIHKECIVLYCLDADLIPFGEEPLPKSLEEFECIILEDFIQFGRCENCKGLNNGCSVGRYGDLSSGTLGFFAKKQSHPSHNGFLTAAHVALTDDVIASLNERKLSDYSFQNNTYQIVHPSFEDSASNNIVGQVDDSFFGNYNFVGIDAAFIKTDVLMHKHELQYSSINFDLDSDEEYEVIKRGRTTGETKGILKECTFLIRRPFPDRAGVYLTLDNCYSIFDSNSQIFFLPGDSGAAVYVCNKLDNTRQPLGLAFGKMTNFPVTFVSPIDKIADVLNLSILQPAEPMEIP